MKAGNRRRFIGPWPALAFGLFIIQSGVCLTLPDGDCFGSADGGSDESLIITDDFLSRKPQEDAKRIVTEGERAFSVNLVKQLFNNFNATGQIKNIFVSPSSIYQTLMLAYFGARRLTARELAAVMGFEGKLTKAQVIKNYMFEHAFQAIRERNPDLGYQLTHANKVYFDRALPLNECLQLLLADELEALDFAANADKARLLINAWVETKTRHKIRDLLPPGSVDRSTRLALVNAAYFKGEWQSQFESANTKLDNFYVRRDEIEMTEFMRQKGSFNYYTSESLRAHVLELPYVGEHVSMIIVLPPFEDDSLHQTVSRLTPETLQGVMGEIKSGFYKVDDLDVQIPKFKIEQTFDDLALTLNAMGARSLFDASSVDLRGFLSKDQANSVADISLQSAIHKSFIEVNEEGSEAAAATVLFGFRSARPLFAEDFRANHPFIFFIYDKETDVIMFCGVYQHPPPAA